MQKTEYTCDRCGTQGPADRMNNLRLTPVFVFDRSITEAREMMEKLNRTLDKMDVDLCNDCVASFKDWLNTRKKEGI